MYRGDGSFRHPPLKHIEVKYWTFQLAALVRRNPAIESCRTRIVIALKLLFTFFVAFLKKLWENKRTSPI